MQIKMKYSAQLKREAGISEELVDLQPDQSFDHLLATIANQHSIGFRNVIFDDQNSRRKSLLIIQNGRQVNSEETLKLNNGDEILLMSPIAGG
ncbi:MoaD/ThiS family protein [Fulvivirgaceae bacterium BMA12]|uniref:MoaD/ThiS family protein n=1 Tax=Agaribacillus aureus TaxID=3051825 RepID=A0ABT8L997_9BACT|nr:MoaD/ThiS family protein [Fulvivirgaceae bacterium BMA12]